MAADSEGHKEAATGVDQVRTHIFMVIQDKLSGAGIKKQQSDLMAGLLEKGIIPTTDFPNTTQTHMTTKYNGIAMGILFSKMIKGGSCILDEYDNNFLDADDLVECLGRGCEVEFIYDRKKYSITHTSDNQVAVVEFYNPDSGRLYSDGQQALRYKIGDKTLKDIILDMKVLDRSF